MTELVLAVCLTAQARGPVAPPAFPPPPRNLPGPPPPTPPAWANARGDRIELCRHDRSDEHLRELVKKSPKATRMQIGWPGLTDSTLAVVAEARDLIELEISAVVAYAQDKGPVGVAISADGWRALAKLPNLRRLSASGVPVNEETCRAIAGLSTLRELKLGCVADDRVVIPLAGMTSLTHLEIVQRGLSAAGLMKVVVKLRELEHLDLSRSPVGDGDMKVIAGLPRLKTLVVYDTKVSDEGVLALASSPTLARVTLERREARDFEAVLNVVEKAKTSSFLHFVGEFGDDRLLHTQFP